MEGCSVGGREYLSLDQVQVSNRSKFLEKDEVKNGMLRNRVEI